LRLARTRSISRLARTCSIALLDGNNTLRKGGQNAWSNNTLGCGTYDAFFDSTLLHDGHGTFVHAHLLRGLSKEAVPVHGR
jgi:hypothetical protein